MERTTIETDGRAAPMGVERVAGAVLWLNPAPWEDALEVQGQHAPIPLEAWIAETTTGGYTVRRLPEGTIDAGPYAGGVVVAAEGNDGRHYFAVPPELIARLAEMMPPAEYRQVRDDLDAGQGRSLAGTAGTTGTAENGTPAEAEAEGDGVAWRTVEVLWIEAAAWSERGAVVPVHAPIPTGEWARIIRDGGMRVTLPDYPRGLGAHTPCPGGVVVTVDDAEGRRYFAVPRTAWSVARDLAVETAGVGVGAVGAVGADRRTGGA